MGRELGLAETQLETLHWGALLHDLGKISVPESILLKPGPLTEQEYAEIQRHPTYGADLLESVAPEFGDIARVVRYHHERWDGRGYPQALSGREIPLMSRIVAVVDVFEALTSRRPYRRPMPAPRALSYLQAESGSHFDPELVSLFEKLYDQGEIRVAQPVAESVGYVPYRCGLKSVNS
jgi:HD-GYP domain-containing protein (c-di-GMP phosphodiesterase class II)